MSKVKKITVSNLKAVSSLTADFNGCTAIITGGNNKGKSSFLKSLPERLQGTKPDMILKQGEKEGFAEWELTTGEKFHWKFDGKKEKLTFISERNIPQSVTKDLSRAYFPPVFDVDEFLNSAPKKQKETLQKLTGIDFTEFDRVYKNAYDERTYANKKLAEEQARKILVDPDLPLFEESTEELEKEIAGIDSHNREYQSTQQRIAEKEKLVSENLSEIEGLQKRIKELENKNTALASEIDGLQDWCEHPENTPKENKAQLEEQLKQLRETNKQIAENRKAIEQDEKIEKVKQEAEACEAEVKRLDAERLDVIKNASMPEGFGFTDDGITYNGYPFNKESLSSSGIYIAALKLAAIGLGDVKTLHFDASFLDKNSLLEIEKWASENDLQLLIERPDYEGGEIEYQLIQSLNGVAE